MQPTHVRHAPERGLRVTDFVIGALCAAALVFAAAGVRAEFGKDRLPLEGLVPPETLLFVTLPDLGKAQENLQKTALYKIYQDPEVQHAVDILLGNLETYRKEFEGTFQQETGVEFEKALEIFSGQVSLALISMPGEGAPVPKAAMALDFGERKEELEKLLGWVLKTVKEGNPGLEEGTWESEGAKILTLGDEEMRFHWTLAGPTLLVATHKDVMESMLARARGGDLPALAENETFKTVLAEAAPGGAPSFLLYANVPGWMAELEKAMGGPEGGEEAQEVRKVLDATGARDLQALAVTMTFSEDGVQDHIYLHAPAARTGVMKILTPGVTAMPCLPLVPADAVGFSAMRVDLASAWDQGFEILKQVNEEAWKELTEEIAKFEKDAGVLVRTDLLGSLGNEVGSWSAYPEGGGLLPYAVTAVALKDPEKFETALERLYGAMGMERKELDWMGQKIRYFVAGLPKEDEGMPGQDPGMGPRPAFGGGEMILLNLTSFSAYFVDGGMLYTSNLVQTLKEVVRGRGKAATARLADSAEFKKLRARLPENPGMVMYFDLKQTFNLAYNTLLPISQYVEVLLRRELGVPFETASLPTAQAVSGKLAPSITAVANRPGGILVSSSSATGVTAVSLAGAAGAGIAAAVLIPTMMRSPAMANESSAMATLKSIHIGQEQFKASNSVDLDVNGVGEYGFPQELAGMSPCRTPGGLEGPSYAASPFIPAIFGMCDEQGRSARSGYFIQVFLPGKEKALSGAGGVPAGDAELAPAQEQRWCAYAWPQQWGRSGHRTFFINQDGMLYATHTPAYSGENGPAASAAFAAQGPNADNLDGPLDDTQPGTDGNWWFPAE